MIIIRKDMLGHEYYMGERVFMYGAKNEMCFEMAKKYHGLVRFVNDKKGIYYKILYYAMPLNDHETEELELAYLGEMTI